MHTLKDKNERHEISEIHGNLRTAIVMTGILALVLVGDTIAYCYLKRNSTPNQPLRNGKKQLNKGVTHKF